MATNNIIEKLKIIESKRNIVAFRIIMHALGKEDYPLTFFVTYNDSYSFNIFLSHRHDNELTHYHMTDEFLEQYHIEDSDIEVVTMQDGIVPLRDLFPIVQNENREDIVLYD